MSEIKVDTLTGKTTANDITVTVGATATQSLEQGLAKAFVVYKSVTSTAIYNSQSLNVSSLSDNGTGSTDVNLSNAHSVSTYATSDSAGDGNTGYSTWNLYINMTSSVYRVATGNNAFAYTDTNYHSVQTYGDLA